MVFALFTRKSTQDDTAALPESKMVEQNARLPTPTPSIVSVSRQSPLRFSTTIRAALGGSTSDLTLKDSDLATGSIAEGGSHAHSPAPPPPETPTPPPVGPNETKNLYDLILTIPPKILHSYTLAHLRPQPPLPASTSSPALGSHPDNTPRPPSPDMVAKLTTFFSTLAPPPLLHCIRCHKDFFDVENEVKDRACRVPHDDESALVSRVSGGGYETLWGCCGQTASGDGSEGPPDGWCYEGRHTTDIKRARFRADSTIHNDKLTSCLKLNCHGIRDRLPRPDRASPSRTAGTSSVRKSNPSPVRSQTSRSARKRSRKSLKDASGSEDEGDVESTTGRAANAKPKEKARGDVGERDKDTSMAVDELNPPSKPRAKAKSRPISRARPPTSTSTSASLPASGTNATPATSSKARTTTRPKSTSRTIILHSHTHLASDSEASTPSRPRTRSLVRGQSRVIDASRSRTISKITKVGISGRTRRTRKGVQALSQSDEEPQAAMDDYQESDQEGRGRDRKKRRVRRD